MSMWPVLRATSAESPFPTARIVTSFPGSRPASLTKVSDLIGNNSDPGAGANNCSSDSFQSFLDRHGGCDTQPLRRILSNSQVVDALSKNVINSQELRPAGESSEQASSTCGTKINAPADDRGNIRSSLHDDEF